MDTLQHTLLNVLQHASPYALFEDSKSPSNAVNNLFFCNPKEEIIAHDAKALASALARIEVLKQQGLFLCGYLSYESGYHFIDKPIKPIKKGASKQPLLYFIAFKTLYRPTRRQLDTLFKQHEDKSALCVHHFNLNTSKDAYLKTIDKIKRYIQSGDTYQINYTLKYRFTLQGTLLQFYSALRHTQPVEFGALLHFPQTKIVSLSPELFIQKKGLTLTSKPMKGTAKRGQTSPEDATVIQAFAVDDKTLSENVMIVDLIRNDFGKVCNIGSVTVEDLFQVQTFKSIHQMISTVYGQLSPDVSLYDILTALFPSGSITGAPKIRAMQIINALETEERGVYTGAMGYLLPDDNFCFNVPIRTILMTEKDQSSNTETHCEMGIGSGIVHQSDAHEEFNECLLKARFLNNINAHFYLIEALYLDTKTAVYHHLEQHLARLSHSATIFGFELNLQRIKEQLIHYKIKLCQQEKQAHDVKVRLTVYQNGKVSIQHDAIRQHEHKTPYRIMLSAFKINSRSIFQYHKTSQRAHYNEAYQLAAKKGYYDVVFLNENDELAEASRHNIFIQTKGHYLTPPLSAGILNGIARAQFMQQHQVAEKKLSLDDLIAADKILLSNAVRGMVSVELDI